jgi:hypothetical protein
LLFIVRAFFNDTITVAVWTGFQAEHCATSYLAAALDFLKPGLGRHAVEAALDT